MADKISEDLILRNHLIDRYNLFYYSSINKSQFLSLTRAAAAASYYSHTNNLSHHMSRYPQVGKLAKVCSHTMNYQPGVNFTNIL